MPSNAEGGAAGQDEAGPSGAQRAGGAGHAERRPSGGEACVGARSPQGPGAGAARHASGDSSLSSGSSCAGCGSCQACAAEADAEDSGDGGDDGTARFLTTVILQRQRPMGSEARVRVALRDSRGVLTSAVLVPDSTEGEVHVQLSDPRGGFLRDIESIDLTCRLASDPPSAPPRPDVKEWDRAAQDWRDAMAGSAAGGADSSDSSDSEATRPVLLRSSPSCHQRRLYRGGDPERRRAPPPFPVRHAARLRRLRTVRWSGRPRSVYVAMVSVDDARTGRRVLFPVHRWLRGPLYRITPLDACLPQDIWDPTQLTLRRAELLHRVEICHYRRPYFDSNANQVGKWLPRFSCG